MIIIKRLCAIVPGASGNPSMGSNGSDLKPKPGLPRKRSAATELFF